MKRIIAIAPPYVNESFVYFCRPKTAKQSPLFNLDKFGTLDSPHRECVVSDLACDINRLCDAFTPANEYYRFNLLSCARVLNCFCELMSSNLMKQRQTATILFCILQSNHDCEDLLMCKYPNVLKRIVEHWKDPPEELVNAVIFFLLVLFEHEKFAHSRDAAQCIQIFFSGKSPFSSQEEKRDFKNLWPSIFKTRKDIHSSLYIPVFNFKFNVKFTDTKSGRLSVGDKSPFLGSFDPVRGVSLQSRKA